MDTGERSLAWGQAAASFAFVAAAGTSTFSKRVKDQSTSANATVSISESTKHKPLLGTKENLAVLTFPVFLGVLLILKQSEKTVITIF